MAAARVSTIARTGSDGKPGSGRRKLPPHLRPVFYAVAVPGSPAPCADSYAAAQILA